tara:strand:- start:1024 stop:1728 length:705 start_codon:yes stop_codon:yes gene_type:complete
MNSGNSRPLIEVEDLGKTYSMGHIEVPALRGVSFDIQRAESVAIMGHSGSGKSTLMNLLGCLDTPTVGKYTLNGEDVSSLGEDELAVARNRLIGFVFQSFNLLPRMSALEQVELPLMYAKSNNRQQLAKEALELVGLGDRMRHSSVELSGGQQQRVAIARALVNKPSLLLADEPTGNLDTTTTNEIMNLLHDLNSQTNVTLIMVTHEDDVASRCKRVIEMRDGRITKDIAQLQP